jgi:hypothetical protein
VACFALSGTRKKCSLNFYVTVGFAEKLKQRGPAGNLYADCIILQKERFSRLLPKPSSLMMVQCHDF